MFAFVCVICYVQSHITCHITFILQVHDQTFISGGGWDVGWVNQPDGCQANDCTVWTSVSMKPLDIFKEPLGQFTAMFCGDQNKYYMPKSNLNQVFLVSKSYQSISTMLSQHKTENLTQRKLQHICGFQKCTQPTFILISGLIIWIIIQEHRAPILVWCIRIGSELGSTNQHLQSSQMETLRVTPTKYWSCPRNGTAHNL